MDSVKQSKYRLPNFTSTEENLLLSLVEQHATILENKRTDAVSWEAQKKAWEQIDSAFEAQMGIRRGPKNLREKYDNMKRNTRKSLAEERREIYRTGGGQYKPCTDPNTERIAPLLGQSATGLSNAYDSDVISFEISPAKEGFLAGTETLDESMKGYEGETVVEATEAAEIEATDWSSWNPTLLRKKKK
ncbi:PREDICTED: uncharacterized protein LOC108358938 [Rhagoletis zephyria]|uniref:uncharacterized protein LOC108358938 n=1 Tax=Rhagoletis zephyria TaxID=28612 RepID=UPI00081144EC|nr:PREDICTED: uncharacterized protein LOC108358938 [Rhagoletis zephyria]XP_017465956.1 PREDICTED: uncharacterized protein LOC108358938 [Rhagoletis zephyria]